MGTHPIFESDFDCLTVKNMMQAGGMGGGMNGDGGNGGMNPQNDAFQSIKALQDPPQGDWRDELYRNKVRTQVRQQIDEQLRNVGQLENGQKSVEWENQVFQRSKNKDEYIKLVATLILKLRDYNKKNSGQQQQQQQPGPRPGNSQPGQLVNQPNQLNTSGGINAQMNPNRMQNPQQNPYPINAAQMRQPGPPQINQQQQQQQQQHQQGMRHINPNPRVNNPQAQNYQNQGGQGPGMQGQ